MGLIQEKMKLNMKLKGFSQNTIDRYLGEVKQFVKYFMRSPDILREEDVKEYLHYLIKVKEYSRSKVILAYSGLKFLYVNTLNVSWFEHRIPILSKEKKLPIVISRDKIIKIFNCARTVRDKNIFQLIYSSGLRVSETLNLKVDDIDSDRMIVKINSAKGNKNLGAKVGFTAILHTWGQNLSYHPHIHCVVSGGGLSSDRSFIQCKKDYFIHVRILSALFKGKLLDMLKSAYKKDDITYDGNFYGLISKAYKKDWVVYAKSTFNKAKHVVKYLGRCTHRIAISNQRIKKISDGKVSFSWKDYKDKNKTKLMTLSAEEFIHRFLLHVLPKGFMRIRHYGILSSRNVKTAIPQCRQILGVTEPPVKAKETWEESLLRITGIDITKCPQCKLGSYMLVSSFKADFIRGP